MLSAGWSVGRAEPDSSAGVAEAVDDLVLCEDGGSTVVVPKAVVAAALGDVLYAIRGDARGEREVKEAEAEERLGDARRRVAAR